MSLFDPERSIRSAVKPDQLSDSPIFSDVSFQIDAHWGIQIRFFLSSDKLSIRACRTADKFFLLPAFQEVAYDQVAKEPPNNFRLRREPTRGERLSLVGYGGQNHSEKADPSCRSQHEQKFLDPQLSFHLP